MEALKKGLITLVVAVLLTVVYLVVGVSSIDEGRNFKGNFIDTISFVPFLFLLLLVGVGVFISRHYKVEDNKEDKDIDPFEKKFDDPMFK